MRDHSPLSPEERRKRLATMRAAFGTEVEEKLKPRVTAWEVVKRVAIGVYNDGFIHAGNLAYLSIVALFPFFIVAAAVAHLLGQSQDATLTVTNVLRRLPPDVAATLREPISEVLTVRTGSLLWLGAIVGLWTATSFIETIRDILRRAYGVKYCSPFWEYRLGSILLILGAVLLLMVAFALSAAMTIAHHYVMEWFPLAQNVGHALVSTGSFPPPRCSVSSTACSTRSRRLDIASPTAGNGPAHCWLRRGGWERSSFWPPRSACSAATRAPMEASPA